MIVTEDGSEADESDEEEADGEDGGVRVERHFIGEAGKNKSQLDGHFAVAGEALFSGACHEDSGVFVSSPQGALQLTM